MQYVDERAEKKKSTRREEEEDRQGKSNVPISFLMQKIVACFVAWIDLNRIDYAIYVEHGNSSGADDDAAGAQQQQQWVDDYQELCWWHSIDPHLNSLCIHFGFDYYLLIALANLWVMMSLLELFFEDSYILYYPFDGKLMVDSFGSSPMSVDFVVVNDNSFDVDDDNDLEPCF